MSNPTQAPTAGQCPVMHGAAATHGSRSNADWWPNQLNLNILHQHAPASSPMDADFDYAEAFKKIDFTALTQDLGALMTDSHFLHSNSVVLTLTQPCLMIFNHKCLPQK